MGTVNALSNNI